MKIKIQILFLVLFAGIQNTANAQQKNDITVKVDPSSGSYTIISSDPAWTFGGTTGQPLHDFKSITGTDAIGQYQAASFSWKSNIQYSGMIRWYEKLPIVMFSFTLPKGAKNETPTAFPEFTTIPSSLYHFSYQNKEFSAPQFMLTQTSTPWLLFDKDKNACAISPASDFIVSLLSGDGDSVIRSGLNPEVKDLPAHFTHTTIMVLDKGIQNTWDVWGNALRAVYHRVRPANDADKVLKYFGYWTDNGADYYYNYDTTLGYANTLLALRKRYKEEGIPLGYLQLDSWWYEKSIYDPEGRPDADHKNPELPSGEWNRYGGLLKYTADPFLFPKGLASFQQQLGLPLVTHNRWVDPKSPYQEQYKISGFAAVDPAFWKSIMNYIKNCGVICYEQDWLSYIYNKSPKMISDLSVGNAFADGMANAAKADDIDLQYCMAMPRFFMQGVKYNNLTTIRTSDDRFEPRKWKPFIFTSQFGYEMGIWPWCDVFKSGETGNMIVSVLSAGPVGTGDSIGTEDKTNIMMACRNDGVLVKPDVPLLPFDKDYIQKAQDLNTPVLAFTYTRHKEITTDYVFAFAEQLTTDMRFEFKPSDLGFSGHVVVYDPVHNKVTALHADQNFSDILPSEMYDYYIVAPVTASGITFFGDAGKIASMGKQRIADITSTSRSLQVKVLFAKGESEVVLKGFAYLPVTSDQGQASYDEDSHIFTINLPAPKSGNNVIVNIKLK
jgi:hypothetical protein